MTVTVRVHHIRAAGLCLTGAAKWFANYGFDWRDFLRNGKSADELDATGDALAFRVTAIARKECISNG